MTRNNLEPASPQPLYRTIDAMPMRQREMRENQRTCHTEQFASPTPG